MTKTGFPPAPISAEHSELLGRYRLSLDRRGLLESSIGRIVQQLRALARWLEPGSILSATREDVETFLDERKTREGKRIGSRTRYYWVANAHTFFDWAMTEGLTDSDPTRAIVRPKQRRVLPRPIDDDDLELAIRGAAPKYRAALMLAAFSGLRVQEIAGLERDDILDAKSLIRVRQGKGRKERIVPLHPDVLEALRCLPMPRTGRLFHRARGGTYTPNALSMYLNRYLRECGIGATVHQMRHWFATETYEHGHDIRVVQELLGHSDPSTTAGYVAYSHVDAAAAVASLRFRKA